EAQFNAYVWWYIRRSYGPIKENGEISKRGYCFAQLSKCIRTGFVGVGATKNPATDVYVCAYSSSTEDVVVVVNRGSSPRSLTLSVPGPSIASYERFTTSSSKSLNDDGAVNASNGTLSVTLDGQSVTTLHGTGDLNGGGGSGGAGGAGGGGGA